MPLFTRQTQKADALAKVPMFAGLNKKERIAVARNTTEIAVAAGDPLTKEATRGREAFLIVRGSVTVRRKGRKMATLGPGDVVGEMSLLDGEPRSATCTAAKDSVLLVMSAVEFRQLLEDVPSIRRKVMVSLSQRLRAADETVIP